MRILIIATYFPPDTAIAAVRPYMFAKYLSAMGNDVTVLCSGLVDKISDDADYDFDGFRIITVTHGRSLLSSDPLSAAPGKKHLSFLPPLLRTPLKKGYNTLKSQYVDIKRITAAKGLFERQKQIIDRMVDNFDVVFSTFGDIENVFAGEYAAKKFAAKWIMDLRDPIVAYHLSYRPIWNTYADRIQKHALKNADVVTTVSHSLSAMMRSEVPHARIVTLTNGFDPKLCDVPTVSADKDVFRICYTGQLYQQREEALGHLLLVIKQLISNGRIERNKIRFAYAGSDSAAFMRVFENAGLADIVQDYGYLTKTEVLSLQMMCDVFLVLSWNTNRSRGMLTGKFYEGIALHRPILSVIAGERPYSELYLLNKKYGYGYCMECCRKQTAADCCKWLTKMYRDKLSKGMCSFKAPHALIESFRYDTLSAKLQKLMQSLITDNGAK